MTMYSDRPEHKKIKEKTLYSDREHSNKKIRQGYTGRGSGSYTNTTEESHHDISDMGSGVSVSRKSSSSATPIRFNDVDKISISNLQVPDVKSAKECAFCRIQGEPVEVYSNHSMVEEGIGKGGKILCEKLKEIGCSICGAKGEKTHVELACPKRNVISYLNRIGPKLFELACKMGSSHDSKSSTEPKPVVQEENHHRKIYTRTFFATPQVHDRNDSHKDNYNGRGDGMNQRSNYKTKPCSNIERGVFCPYGANCLYIHPGDQVDKPIDYHRDHRPPHRNYNNSNFEPVSSPKYRSRLGPKQPHGGSFDLKSQRRSSVKPQEVKAGNEPRTQMNGEEKELKQPIRILKRS